MADQENVPQQPAAARLALGMKRRAFTAPAFVAGSVPKRLAVAAAKPAVSLANRAPPARPPAASAEPSACAATQPGEALYFTVLYCKYQVRG